jgi:prevent-host-death family protein
MEHEVGVRELKANASELVRQVREQRAEYVVTHRGRPVAKLVPIPDPAEDEEPEDGWVGMFRLADKLRREPLPAGTPSVQEIMDEMRR